MGEGRENRGEESKVRRDLVLKEERGCQRRTEVKGGIQSGEGRNVLSVPASQPTQIDTKK